VRPIALLLSLPALVLTLGLFYFVLNGLLLWAFSQFMPGYSVNGLWAGILGSLVIMVVNWVASALFGGTKK
jgi:putative membrane protein